MNIYFESTWLSLARVIGRDAKSTGDDFNKPLTRPSLHPQTAALFSFNVDIFVPFVCMSFERDGVCLCSCGRVATIRLIGKVTFASPA